MKAYLFQNVDNILMDSSSGGAFQGVVTVFYSLYQTGKCYGAAFDENFNVQHMGVDSLVESKKFNTSKYCFSDYANTFPSVASDLEAGIAVLYSGTPCQIAALKGYLNRKKICVNNLITIDILCHGAPDKMWWEQYRKWLEKKIGATLSFFSFRWKRANWNGYSLHAEFENGVKKTNTHDLQVYMDLYFSNHIMRKSCYQCQFASDKRVSDITLGDFWGIENVMPNVLTRKQIEKGTSLVLGNTEKGCTILETLELMTRESMATMQLCNNNEYKNYQTALNAPVHEPENQEEFDNDFQISGFDYILKKYAGFRFRGKVRFKIKQLVNVLGLVNLIKLLRKFLKG